MLWSELRLILKTSSVNPDFFYVFYRILSFSTVSQSLKKKSVCGKFLGANVLKCRNCKSVQYAYRSKTLLRLNMHRQRSIPKEDIKNKLLRFAFSKIHRTWSFHVVVLQMTAEKFKSHAQNHCSAH